MLFLLAQYQFSISWNIYCSLQPQIKETNTDSLWVGEETGHDPGTGAVRVRSAYPHYNLVRFSFPHF